MRRGRRPRSPGRADRTPRCTSAKQRSIRFMEADPDDGIRRGFAICCASADLNVPGCARRFHRPLQRSRPACPPGARFRVVLRMVRAWPRSSASNCRRRLSRYGPAHGVSMPPLPLIGVTSKHTRIYRRKFAPNRFRKTKTTSSNCTIDDIDACERDFRSAQRFFLFHGNAHEPVRSHCCRKRTRRAAAAPSRPPSSAGRFSSIEQGKRVGGVSVHTGTIPSKTLRETALNLSGWRERGFYGRAYRVKEEISAEDLRQRLIITLDHEVEVLEHQFARNRVQQMRGKASFRRSAHACRWSRTTAKLLQVSATSIMLAVGTKPFRPGLHALRWQDGARQRRTARYPRSCRARWW